MKRMKYKILSLLFLSSRIVSAQDDNSCFSLNGSTTCPAFSSFYISITGNQQQYPFLANVTNITSFDIALNNYVQSANLYLSSLGCTNKADTTTKIPYARYSLTFMCASLIQDSSYSLPCNYQYNKSPPPLCQSTCFEYTSSINDITDNIDICPNQLEQANQLANLNSSCWLWSGLNGTTDCIIGLANEPNFCGFDTKSGACSYCKSNSNDACCGLVSGCRLSIGAIVGITLGCLVIVGLAIAILWYRFKKPSPKRHEAPVYESMLSRNTHMSSSQSTIQDKPPLISTPLDEFYQVKHPYPPQMGDELGLHIGDIICVAMNFDDGWALGFNVTTGLKGVFPIVCVAPAPEELLEQLLEQTEDKVLVENIRRSLSVSSKRSINTLPVSELTHHQSIPRRTASMMRRTYDDIDSPTSPTLHTPFFDTSISAALSHPEPALIGEAFEMYRKI